MRFERLLLVLTIYVLITHTLLTSAADPKKKSSVPDDDDEDLTFLQESDAEHLSSSVHHHPHSDPDLHDFDDEDEGDDEDFDSSAAASYGSFEPPPLVDDKDVVVLTDSNFSHFIAANKHVLVEFYAPWCGHCQALAPEYAAAATSLKDEKQDVVLAKVDATEENDLGQKYEIQGFPTVLFFIDGVHKPYTGQRTKDAIVTWIKKKIGPGVHNITTVEEAEKILGAESKVVLGFLDSLVGTDSLELASASKLEDDVSFYQTANSEVAKVFGIDTTRRPSLVLLKKEAEKTAYFDGGFNKAAIVDFVFANKLPLINNFTRETAQSIFENPIKKQVLLFTVANDSEKYIPVFQEVAKSFKGKLIFVYVEMDNEEVGVPVSDYFGVRGSGPKVLGYTGNEDAKKYILDNEVTLDSVKIFCEDFLQDKLKPFYKSDPVPEVNDGDVKLVVGINFDEIVLDESKDVLLEIYAPWCGHCQALEPIYNKLAKHLRGIGSLVIAKMDGTTNEHPRAKADGFPTLLFFPAGNKSFDPITVETDRTVVAFYKFIKKHAAIPFKLQKPVSTAATSESNNVNAVPSDKNKTSDDVKDEL